jgi:hypothetical protein
VSVMSVRKVFRHSVETPTWKPLENIIFRIGIDIAP